MNKKCISKIVFVQYLILLLMLPAKAFSQQSGFLGKKFIIHFDALQPIFFKGFNFGIEYAIARNISVEFGFQHNINSYKQKLEPYYYRNGTFPIELGNINTQTFETQINYYINQSFPAPLGSFLYFKYATGIAHLKGNYFKIIDYNKPEWDEYLSYDIKNINTQLFELGIGRTLIFWNKCIVQPQIGVAISSINASKYNYVIQGIANNYGAQVLNFGAWRKNAYGSLGLQLDLKLGYLIF
jgi:hypothetical protein